MEHARYPVSVWFVPLRIALSLVLLGSANAQEPSRIRFIPLSKSTPGGLESDEVRGITQDLGGYIWMATDRGLCRFDGFETIHYRDDGRKGGSLSSEQLTVLASPARKKGALWIGTSSQGLMKFIPDSGEVTVFARGADEGAPLRSDHIVDLAIFDDALLWIATDAGLNVLDLSDDRLATVDGPLGTAPIASITVLDSVEGNPELWIGTVRGELYQWDPKQKTFGMAWQTSVPVTCVAKDRKKALWIGTDGMGLHMRSAEAKASPVPVPLENRGTVNSLALDSNGDLWVGTSAGLALYDPENESFTYFNHSSQEADSLCDDHVSAIYEDRSRMLWITTLGGGTSRFSLERKWFTHIRHQTGRGIGLPHDSVRDFATAGNGAVWIGTGNGVVPWHTDSGFVKSNVTGPLAEANVNDLVLDRTGSLWVGTRGQGLIVRALDGTVRTFRHNAAVAGSIGHDNILALHEDSKGRLWVGTMGAGLFRREPADNTFLPVVRATGNPVPIVRVIAEDAAGALWIAGNDGVHVLPSDGSRLISLRTMYPGLKPLSSQLAAAILPDRNGFVWIGFEDAGIDRLNLATGEVTNFSNAVHGLPDDHIVSLAKDRTNLLWVVTRNGVARLNAMQNEFRLFGEEDGLQRAGFNPGAIAKDGKGRLCIGGEDGFNLIDPARLPALPRAPNPTLTSFEYYGEAVVPEQGGILEREVAATNEIRMPFNTRLLFGFRFANLDYRFPNRGYFRYRLEGYELNWNIAREDRRAVYANVPYGSYVFKVQSSLDGRTWPDVTAKVRVVITPPWWQTWWARTLGLGCLVLATVVATRSSIRSRVREMRRHEEMLTAQRDKAEATLARQLQNRMLLERSTRELRNEGSDSRILSGVLQQIVGDFQATHCLVLRLPEREVSVEDGTASQLNPIGSWSTGTGSAAGALPGFSMTDGLIQRILAVESLVIPAANPLIPGKLRAAFPKGTPISLLAAKTRYLDSANGIVLLLRIGIDAPWNEDDTKLLETLTGQFGITIAQINTAEIEETYRRDLEEAHHQAEVANRAKSDFLAKMTHELRTPLNAIIGFSEILGEDRSLTPKQRETLDIINNSGEHLLDVINEILDLSKIEAGKMERHDETFELLPLLKSVHEMLSFKAKEKRIAFTFSARTELPGEIVTDRSKLRQILINLIGNAIKFTAQGGVGISIASELASDPVLADGRLRRGVRLRFEIRDTGRGIREDEIGKLFERYSQTESGRRSSEGTGLGLPIARSFVQLMGGDITVESRLGEGTAFRFYVLCDELAPARIETIAATASLDEKTAQRISGFTSSLGEVRILIAEDQPTNRLLLRRILGKAGFTLAEAENGREAIEKWREWHPHLILMDEDMPVMKGSEATREIQAESTDGERPVIVSLTAYALEQARLAALEAGCSDFVAKPFRSHELFAVISKHLGVDYTFNDAA
jgi:signal transduction histidine kinase/ligand-binding sensor domain-containing protein/CheY-like chemotaxis protein